jgi:hypothetical protein
MTDSTPVRRYIAMVHTLTDGDGLIPLADAEPVGVVLASDFDRLAAENERLASWIRDLQSGMYINCVYCGHRYGPAESTPESKADMLKAHIEQCPQHPMSALRSQLAAALAKVEWQPIETAPAEGESLFYVVPREPHEQPLFERRDKGVVQTWKPYVFLGRYRTWSCLAKATHWMPLPDPPAMTAKE